MWQPTGHCSECGSNTIREYDDADPDVGYRAVEWRCTECGALCEEWVPETRGKERMKFHTACKIFPELNGAEFEALVADIADNGQREPVLLDSDGVILDGRNRYRACQQLGIEPRTRTWKPKDGDTPLALVISMNIRRRHLDAGQIAGVTLKLLRLTPEIKRRARNRMKAGKPSPILEQGRAVDEACAITGASKSYTFELQSLVADDEALLDQVIAGAVTIPELKAAQKAEAKAAIAERIRNAPPPPEEGPYSVIVVDPPWCYANRAEDATHRARNPYPDMTLEEICTVPISTLAADDCILWLWTTNAFMHHAFAVLEAWGFEQKTILTWVKNQMGTGDWLRGRTEHCLLAVRGKPLVMLTNQTTALIADRGRHSEKPDEFYALVESLCPGSKLEMFGRRKRDGWVVRGAEVDADAV